MLNRRQIKTIRKKIRIENGTHTDAFNVNETQSKIIVKLSAKKYNHYVINHIIYLRKIWLELASKQNEDLEVFTEGKKKTLNMVLLKRFWLLDKMQTIQIYLRILKWQLTICQQIKHLTLMNMKNIYCTLVNISTRFFYLTQLILL